MDKQAKQAKSRNIVYEAISAGQVIAVGAFPRLKIMRPYGDTGFVTVQYYFFRKQAATIFNISDSEMWFVLVYIINTLETYSIQLNTIRRSYNCTSIYTRINIYFKNKIKQERGKEPKFYFHKFQPRAVLARCWPRPISKLDTYYSMRCFAVYSSFSLQPTQALLPSK